MSFSTSQTNLPLPKRIRDFQFKCRCAPDGSYSFDAPANDSEQILELSPNELSRLLTTGQFPSASHFGFELMELIRGSSKQLNSWCREIRCRGPRTGKEITLRTCGVPQRQADGSVVWSGFVLDMT